jgi:hypothetical protein
MTDNHQITPPDNQLVRKWIEDWAGGQMKGPVTEDQLVVATQAAQWGAEMELEACCEWLFMNGYDVTSARLRAARCPKPPSDKELALEALQFVDEELKGHLPLHNHCNAIHTIRLALEALPND